MRKWVWFVAAAAYFLVAISIILAVPPNEVDGQASFYRRLTGGPKWWLHTKETSSYCRKLDEPLTDKKVAQKFIDEKRDKMCATKCASTLDKEFEVIEIPVLDYALMFDRISSCTLLWLLSMMADTGVICFHIRHRPHPKFTLSGYRLFTITCHALGGTFECISGLFVFFLTGETRLAMIYFMSFFSWLHIITAVLQTSIVFGTKKIMIPAYMCAIAFKILCWVKLMLHMWGGSEEILILNWFLSLELIHHIYVWVRVSLYACYRLNLFRGQDYTFAILMAGMVCVYPALGAIGLIFFMAWIAVYQNVWKLCVRDKVDQAGHHIELDRNPHLSTLYRERSIDALKKLAAKRQFVQDTSFVEELNALTEDEKISYCFNILDLDNSGKLQVEELQAMLVNWGCPASDARNAMKARNLAPHNDVNLKQFKESF